MPKNIPTSAEWKTQRETTFKLPKGVGPSFGSLLDTYHKEKKKGTKSALKALLAVQKVAKTWPDTKKVRDYIVDNRLLAEEAQMDAYFADLNKKIDSRVAKLKKYEQIIKNAASMTLADVFNSAKLRAAFGRMQVREFSAENFDFIVDYDTLNFNPNQGMASQVAKAMAFINTWELTTSNRINIEGPQATAIKNLKAREKDILSEVSNRQKSVLWKQLCEALAGCRDNLWKLMSRDTLNRFIYENGKGTEEFRAVLAKMKGVDKWDT